MGISFWRKGLQSKSGGTRSLRSCQIHQEQILVQRNLGHGRSEAEVRVGIFDPAGPERDQEIGIDVLEHGNRDGKPEKPGDCVVSQTVIPKSCAGVGPW